LGAVDDIDKTSTELDIHSLTFCRGFRKWALFISFKILLIHWGSSVTPIVGNHINKCAMCILRFSESIGKWERINDSQRSNATNMIHQCLGFRSLSVPHDDLPAIIEGRLDGLIDFTSSRFFQAGPTRPEVTKAVAVEVGGMQPSPLLRRLWRLRIMILACLQLFLSI
jgi:hypothetical protein